MELEAKMIAEKAAQYASQTGSLEQRVRVLERIVTDRGIDVADEIEKPAISPRSTEHRNRRIVTMIIFLAVMAAIMSIAVYLCVPGDRQDELARFFTDSGGCRVFVDPGRGRGPADRLGLAVGGGKRTLPPSSGSWSEQCERETGLGGA